MLKKDFGEGNGGAGGDIEQCADLAVGPIASKDRFEQGLFAGAIERSVVPVRPNVLNNRSVHDGSVRLHQVIGQTKRVIAIVVVESERRVQPGGADCATHDGAKYGVAVVEQSVGVGGVKATAEKTPLRSPLMKGGGYP